MRIHLHRDEYGDLDVYSCPAPVGCLHEGRHPGSALLGQIVRGRTLVGIRYGSAFEFTEWQWVPDEANAEAGPMRHAYSHAFEDARRYAGSPATGSTPVRQQDREATAS